MLNKLSTPLLATLLLSATTHAAPTRTHCRCSIVSNAPSSATTPSSAHWSQSAIPSASPLAAADICASLGPELERIQQSKPELYDSYITSKPATIDDEQRPLPTSVLMDFSSRKGSNEESEEEAQSTSQPLQQRIVCYSEPVELFTTFQSSVVNLWALQIIVAILILVCVAEGVGFFGRQWYVNTQHPIPIQMLTVYRMEKRNKALTTPQSPSEIRRLRLLGSEKLLLAVPTGPNQNSVCSPGAEKKLRAYETTRYFVTQTPGGRREFIAYDDDSDDESNRPVM
jgi:hypothetical protein